MSTEASGDSRTDAAGAAEPGVTAEGTYPTAAVSDEQQAARAAAAEPAVRGAEAPSDRSAPAPADAGAAEPASVPGHVAPDDAEAADEAAHADDTGESEEAAHADDTRESEEAEAEEPEEVAASYVDYGHDEDLGHDEDHTGYGEYGLEAAAEPQRARRWPRMLLALGFLMLTAAIVGGAIAIVGSLTHGFKKQAKVTYKKSPLFSLKTGDCFDPQGQSYTLIPCDSPHDAEVFATFTLSGTKWPGTTAIAKEANHGCASLLTGYLNPQLAISLSSSYVYPDSVAWQAGTRTVICEVRAKSGQLTGSVRSPSATTGG